MADGTINVTIGSASQKLSIPLVMEDVKRFKRVNKQFKWRSFSYKGFLWNDGFIMLRSRASQWH